MRKFKLIVFLVSIILMEHARSSVLLSNECLGEIREKVNKIMVTLYNCSGCDSNPASGIQSSEMKELNPTRHPINKTIMFRVFELPGWVDTWEYRARLTLANTRDGECSIYGVDLMRLSPTEHSESGIKHHNDNLYPPKSKKK